MAALRTTLTIPTIPTIPTILTFATTNHEPPPQQTTNNKQQTTKNKQQTRSRHSYGPAVFASSQHGPCIKSTTLTGFLFSLWKTIIHFRWYLHDFEAMNSQFYPCLASMCNTRVWKKNRLFCLSTRRPSQPASSTCLRCPSLCDKQTQTRSLGWIHSHLEWAYACCTAPWVYHLPSFT